MNRRPDQIAADERRAKTLLVLLARAQLDESPGWADVENNARRLALAAGALRLDQTMRRLNEIPEPVR